MELHGPARLVPYNSGVCLTATSSSLRVKSQRRAMNSFTDNVEKYRKGFLSKPSSFFAVPAGLQVLAGPQYGVDVAIINLPNGMDMALTSDPLSLVPLSVYRSRPGYPYT